MPFNFSSFFPYQREMRNTQSSVTQSRRLVCDNHHHFCWTSSLHNKCIRGDCMSAIQNNSKFCKKQNAMQKCGFSYFINREKLNISRELQDTCDEHFIKTKRKKTALSIFHIIKPNINIRSRIYTRMPAVTSAGMALNQKKEARVILCAHCWWLAIKRNFLTIFGYCGICLINDSAYVFFNQEIELLTYITKISSSLDFHQKSRSHFLRDFSPWSKIL